MYQTRSQQAQNAWEEYLKSDILNLIIESSDGQGEVWLGNIDAAKNTDLLKSKRIKSVLSVASRTGLRYNQKDIPNHMIIPAEDVSHFDLSRYFDQMANFVESSRREGNVLVHCFAGISRSSSGVISYMISKLGYTFYEALHHCQAKRSIVDPNPGFTKQLIQYERTVKQRKEQQERSKSNQHSPYLSYSESKLSYLHNQSLLSHSTLLSSIYGAKEDNDLEDKNNENYENYMLTHSTTSTNNNLLSSSKVNYQYSTPKKKSTFESQTVSNSPSITDEKQQNDRYQDYLNHKFNLRQSTTSINNNTSSAQSQSQQQQQFNTTQGSIQASSSTYQPLIRPSSVYSHNSPYSSTHYLDKYSYLKQNLTNATKQETIQPRMNQTNSNFYSSQKQDSYLNFHNKNQSQYDFGKYNLKQYSLNSTLNNSSSPNANQNLNLSSNPNTNSPSTYIKSITYSDNKPKLMVQKQTMSLQEQEDEVPKRPLQVSNSNYSQSAQLANHQNNLSSYNYQAKNVTQLASATATSHNFYQLGMRSSSTNPYARHYVALM